MMSSEALKACGVYPAPFSRAAHSLCPWSQIPTSSSSSSSKTISSNSSNTYRSIWGSPHTCCHPAISFVHKARVKHLSPCGQVMAKALLVWGPSWAPADSLAGMARQHLAQPLWQVLARPTEALGVVKLCPPSTLHQTLKVNRRKLAWTHAMQRLSRLLRGWMPLPLRMVTPPPGGRAFGPQDWRDLSLLLSPLKARPDSILQLRSATSLLNPPQPICATWKSHSRQSVLLEMSIACHCSARARVEPRASPRRILAYGHNQRAKQLRMT
mmetsp:Transcript_13478/g.36492  ORF Transcript_13478/g.36492 Transcript_13478/m.36492 type:complete len:269 (-) Transcript_13478:281-1087(-)